VNYGALLRRSWALTWHHRFLWVLALFAGSTSYAGSSAVGDLSTLGSSVDEVGRVGPEVGPALAEPGRWIAQNLELVLAVGAILVLIVLALLVVSFICQGALARAAIDLALDRPSGLRAAWRAGRRLFWRYVRLVLLLFGLSLAVLLMLAGVYGLGYLAFTASGGALGPPLVIGGGLLGVVVVLLSIPLLIAVSIVVVLAQRAMAAEAIGSRAGLVSGYRLLRANLGPALLSWLLSVGLSIGIGVGILFALLVLALPLGLIGLILYFVAGGFSTGLVVYGAVAAAIVVVAILLLNAVSNAFIWNYWSLVYLRLRGLLDEDLLPPALEFSEEAP
jgi:hypothetical protein